jgi:hypothetical protein
MNRYFSLRQVVAIVAAAVTISVCATIFALYSAYASVNRHVISFDAETVDLDNVVNSIR